MENDFIQQGSWQGWNDFLGVTKEDNIENYLVNLIGDIEDGFMFDERRDELASLLVHDTKNSFLIHSVYAYKSIKPDNTSWHQVRIYNVDEYFLVISVNWDNTYQHHYIGRDVNITVNDFFRNVEILQELFANMLAFQLMATLDMNNEEVRKSYISDYFASAGYEVPKFTKKDIHNLKHVLQKLPKKKQRDK